MTGVRATGCAAELLVGLPESGGPGSGEWTVSASAPVCVIRGSEVRGIRGQRSEVRGQRSEVRGSEGQRVRGSEGQRVRGSEGQRVRGSEGQRVRGSEGQRVRKSPTAAAPRQLR